MAVTQPGRKPRPTKEATAKAAAEADQVAVANRKPPRELPPAPKGWSPSASKDDALRYSRRSQQSGHVVDIYDSTHPKVPRTVPVLGLKKDDKPGEAVVMKDVPGEGRYVVIDRNTGATARSNVWAEAYSLSRIIDGQPTPESKYIARYFVTPPDGQVQQTSKETPTPKRRRRTAA